MFTFREFIAGIGEAARQLKATGLEGIGNILDEKAVVGNANDAAGQSNVVNMIIGDACTEFQALTKLQR